MSVSSWCIPRVVGPDTSRGVADPAPSPPPLPLQALLSRDILVTLPEHGLRLAFEPLTQRLRLLEILDSSHLLVTYQKARAFGGMAHPPCLGGMYDTFGPTYPGGGGEVMLFPLPECCQMSLMVGNTLEVSCLWGATQVAG